MKLRTDSIKKSYKGRPVVKGVSIEVSQGEIVGLLGPNGAGKTTSFYMIVGLVRPNEGTVYLDDLDITKHAMYKRAQLGIGYLPQEVSVFRKMSVEDNIKTVLEMTKLSKTEQKDKLETLLEEFGLNHIRTNLGQSLSGGEKRRTEIARALATDPKFILLDEPFAGVDPIAVADIQKIVAQLKERNIGVLITDHNVQETLSITDRTYLLFEGNILREGTAEFLAADEMVRKVYLGEHFELRKKIYEDDSSDANEISSISYVENILNVAKQLVHKLENDVALEESEVRDFLQNLEELKIELKNNNPSKSLLKVIDDLKLSSASHAKASRSGEVLSVLATVTGLSTLSELGRHKAIEDFKNDMRLLVSRIETVKHLLKHPELENELD